MHDDIPLFEDVGGEITRAKVGNMVLDLDLSFDTFIISQQKKKKKEGEVDSAKPKQKREGK